MLAGIKDRIVKALSTPAGERIIRDLETAAAAAESRVQRRRELVASIDAAHGRRREELPALEDAAEAAVEAQRAAFERLREAKARRTELASAAVSARIAIDEAIRRAEAALVGDADPRLAEAAERIAGALRDWRLTHARLHKSELREVLVDPDPSDPSFKRMKVFDLKYRMQRFGSNAAAVEALRDGLDHLAKRVRATQLLADPTDEDVLGVLGLVDAFLLQLRDRNAPAMEWTDPAPPRFPAGAEDAWGAKAASEPIVALDEAGRDLLADADSHDDAEASS